MSRGIHQVSRRTQIAAMVARSNGVSASTVAEAFRISLKHASDDLRRLHEHQRVSRAGTKRGGILWFAPGAHREHGKTAPVRPVGVDYRFHVPADFRGAFSLAGIGRDVQTGRVWGA